MGRQGENGKVKRRERGEKERKERKRGREKKGKRKGKVGNGREKGIKGKKREKGINEEHAKIDSLSHVSNSILHSFLPFNFMIIISYIENIIAWKTHLL